MSVNRGTVPGSEAGPYRKYGRSGGRMGRRTSGLRIRLVARVGRAVLTQLEARRHAVGLQVFLGFRGVRPTAYPRPAGPWPDYLSSWCSNSIWVWLSTIAAIDPALADRTPPDYWRMRPLSMIMSAVLSGQGASSS